MSGDEQAQVAELALSRAKRIAESGKDAVLIVDSLSRLAAARGRVDAAKTLFGSRTRDRGGERGLADRDRHGAGRRRSRGRGGDHRERADRARRRLAAAGIFPAVDASGSRVSGEADLREGDELDAARRLRSLLVDLQPRDAAAMLRERIEGSADNAELLKSV